MKKILSIILIVSTILGATSCKLVARKYVISDDRCVSLFGGTSEAVADNIDESYWIDGNYVSADVDEDGNLVLVLDDKHIQHWKKELTEYIETKYNTEKSYGEEYGFEYDKTYTNLIYYTDREICGGAMVDLALLLPKFGMLQMLDEKDPNKWYVDITIKDAETGTTIKTGRMPDDVSFSITDEDWDKALGEGAE